MAKLVKLISEIVTDNGSLFRPLHWRHIKADVLSF